MPNPLDALRAKARRDVDLDSGDVVTVRRISMVDAVLLAEDVPVPVVNQLASEESSEDTPERPEDSDAAQAAVAAMRKNRSKQNEVIRNAVVQVNGTDVTIEPYDDLSELFTDADRLRIANAALWLDAEGKA